MEIGMTPENEGQISETENEGSIFDPHNSLYRAKVISAGEKRAKSMAFSFCVEEQIKSWRITMEFDERGNLKTYSEVALDDKGNVLPFHDKRKMETQNEVQEVYEPDESAIWHALAFNCWRLLTAGACPAYTALAHVELAMRLKTNIEGGEEALRWLEAALEHFREEKQQCLH
jgi:hypothetical protein